MTTELLRGKVHLNANDQTQLYRSKKHNLQADLHHNKNLNIFNGDGYRLSQQHYDLPYQSPSYDLGESADTNEYINPALVPRKSPVKDKYGKLGSLFNPNQVDPRKIQLDPLLNKPAGVTTNYGLGDSQNYYVDTEQDPQVPSQSSFQNLPTQDSNRLRSGLGQAGLNAIQGNQNLKQNKSQSSYAANSANFGLEQSKFNDHMQSLAGGRLGGTVGRHMSNPYNNMDLRPSASSHIVKPYSPQLGRHGSNPNAQKNLQYQMNSIKKPTPQHVRNIDDAQYGFEPMTIQPKSQDPYEMEQRRASAMTQMNTAMPASPGMAENRGNMAVYQSQVLEPTEIPKYSPAGNPREKRFSSIEVPPSRDRVSQMGGNNQLAYNNYGSVPSRGGTYSRENMNKPSNANVDPVSLFEQNKYMQDKMLIEQDPFLLEEQRYLDRIQRANQSQEVKYKKHYENYTAPSVNKLKQMEDYENQKIEMRLKSLAAAQERQKQMKQELVQSCNDAVEKQLLTKNQQRSNLQREKEIQYQQMLQQTELLKIRDQQLKQQRLQEQAQYKQFLEQQRRGEGNRRVVELV